jgi:isoleucyl-tRNA synthetase
MFKAVSTNISLPNQEAEVLEFWQQQKIYEKSLQLRAGSPSFVFYEGPPTANGMPHPGHCLTRAIKDVFPRYKTMRGYLCERKAGWDTHGLPVEVEVCKELGIHGKDEIEAYGIEPFIQKCQQSVWRYMQEWERLTDRIGFWIDLSEAYVTYHKSYVESVWWSLKNLFDRGLLYRGHKIVWWWAQGGTALSSGEVGQGYREVADPSVYVLFPLENDPQTSLVVWTTTPWTLPTNQFAAVNPAIEYAVCCDADTGEKFILAAALVEKLAEKTKRDLTVESTMLGSDLVGQNYRPPFDYYFASRADQTEPLINGQSQRPCWRVVAADFVTTESGTGLVHLAPAFGEVDYEVLADERKRFANESVPELLCAVGPDGKFTDEAPDFTGQWVKDADKPILRRVKENGKLFHQEQYLHDYPFCWRAEQDPLIQYPRESWFIRTTEFRDEMLENNSKINWLPEHIKEGRFGNFLRSNVDWALSRERYWGTPLPIWECEKTGQREAIDCYDELLAKPNVTGTEVWENAKAANPELVDDLKVHKPYIDAIQYDSPFAANARMTRVPEVIDCWYDSGAMPFAQWGYPHQNADKFAQQFPADFISEALDQTRGWFYSQLAISTMLFGKSSERLAGLEPTKLVADKSLLQTPNQPYPHPFQNCIVLGLMLSEWYEDKKDNAVYLTEEEARQKGSGKYVSKTGKMSKSKRNYRSPNEIFDQLGADALRWYFFANQPPWNSIVYAERSIRDSIPDFLLRLWNVFSFFTIYAEIDGFAGPSKMAKNSRLALEQLSATELGQCQNYRPVSDRGELDRWMMSELTHACEQVTLHMDAYDNYGACQHLHALVEGLSNWFVRRSRSRYWAADKTDQDKLDAYWTLYESLVTITKLIAPFTPFMAETLWKKLTEGLGDSVRESVHLCDYPTADPSLIDLQLIQRMQLLREIASLGRSARMEAKLKVRQPLARVEVSLVNNAHEAWLIAHDDILRDELNVKEIVYISQSSPYIDYAIQPNFKKLGPKLGKLLPKLKATLAALNGADLLEQMSETGKVELDLEGQKIELDGEDISVRLQAKEGWAAAQGKNSVVVLSTELTESLILEGIARDLIRLFQDLRKTRGCNFTDRIKMMIATTNPQVIQSVENNHTMIQSETLGTDLNLVETFPNDIEPMAVEVAGETIQIALQVQ